jgi:hypothetical protein
MQFGTMPPLAFLHGHASSALPLAHYAAVRHSVERGWFTLPARGGNGRDYPYYFRVQADGGIDIQAAPSDGVDYGPKLPIPDPVLIAAFRGDPLPDPIEDRERAALLAALAQRVDGTVVSPHAVEATLNGKPCRITLTPLP